MPDRIDTTNVRRLTMHCRRCRRQIGEVVSAEQFTSPYPITSDGMRPVITCPCGYRNRWFKGGTGLTTPKESFNNNP